MLAALVRRGRRCVSDALARRRASRAALCRTSIARPPQEQLIGPPPSALSICRTHTPPAFARVLCAAISATPNNTRPPPLATCTGVVVELEGAVGKPKVRLRVPHRDQFYFFRTESCPHWTTSGEDKWGEQLLLQATSSAPLRPATPRDGLLKAAFRATSGAADFASWAAALTSIAKAKWVVQAAITGRRARRSRPTMDDEFGSVSDSASRGRLAQGPAF